jgi:hypothetical protein
MADVDRRSIGLRDGIVESGDRDAWQTRRGGRHREQSIMFVTVY